MRIKSALVLLCTMGVALAQTPTTPPPGPPNAEQRLEHLAVLLDLTDAQKAQVLNASQLKKFEVLMEEERGSGRRPHGHWRGDAPPPPASQN